MKYAILGRKSALVMLACVTEDGVRDEIATVFLLPESSIIHILGS